MPQCIISTLQGIRCKNQWNTDGVCRTHKKSLDGGLYKVFLPKPTAIPGSTEYSEPIDITSKHSFQKCIARFINGKWEIQMASYPKDIILVKPVLEDPKQFLPKPKPNVFLNEQQTTHRKSVVNSVMNAIEYLKANVVFTEDNKLTTFTYLVYDMQYYNTKISNIHKRDKAFALLIKYASGHMSDYAGIGTVITNEVDSYSISSRELLVYVYKRVCDLAQKFAAEQAIKENISITEKPKFISIQIVDFISNFLACLSEELISSDGMCAAGRISRIINALAGFDTNITIGVSASEMMQSRMTVIMSNALKIGSEGSSEYNAHVLEHIYNALSESEMPETDWQAWIDPFIT